MLEKLNIGFWDITNIVTGIIDWIIFFLAIDSVGKRKESSGRYVFGIGFIIIYMSIINLYRVPPNIKIIMCIVLGMLFYLSCYKDKIYKSIVVSLLFWLFLMISEGISFGILVILNPSTDSSIILNESLFRIEGIIISKLLLFIVLIVFKYLRLSMEFKAKDMVLIGIPILSNIVCLIVMFDYNVGSSSTVKKNIFIFIASMSLIVLSSVILLIVIGKIVRDDKIKLEYELINERIRSNHKNYENINEIYDKLRYVHHDLKNHLICIKNYNTKDEIISYINNLEFQISDFESLRNTGNETLDIILGEKIYLCKKNGIEFEDSINISKLNFIQNNDICSIFANALDNAIEACMNINNEIEKRIEVKATYINQFAMIKFTNTKVNDIKFIDEHIVTNKKDDKVHGIGVASIKYIVNKYEGETIVNYSDNEFILKIMIPMKD